MRWLGTLKTVLWWYVVGISTAMIAWQWRTDTPLLQVWLERWGHSSVTLLFLALVLPLLAYTYLQVRWLRALLEESRP